MKKTLLALIVLMCYLQQKSNAQIPGNTCGTAYAVTSTTVSSGSATTSFPNTDTSNDYGCIAPANNAVWFYFQACGSGTVTATLDGAFGSGCDFDFIVWGPLTAATDCGLTTGQILDCSSSASTSDTMNFPVISGSFYKFLIANPSNCSTTGFMVTFLPTSPILSDSCYNCMAAIPQQQVCQVTTDPVLNKNIIIWEKDTTYTGDYLIQKESTAMGVYTTLATIANNDTSAYMDSVSNPSIQAFLYRVATNDTCGNLNETGYPHQTIHLLTSVSSSSGYPQLNWNPYSGYAYGTYYIYRGTSAATLVLYDSMSASSSTYTDVGAVTGMNYYSIAVMPAVPCQPSRAMTRPSMSNTSPVMFTGINEFEFNQLTTGPNPATGVLNFNLGSITADITIDVIDITGRVLLTRYFENVNSDVVQLNDISNGSYIVRFTSGNGTKYKNIVVAR